jgi:hypothetical protein
MVANPQKLTNIRKMSMSDTLRIPFENEQARSMAYRQRHLRDQLFG